MLWRIEKSREMSKPKKKKKKKKLFRLIFVSLLSFFFFIKKGTISHQPKVTSFIRSKSKEKGTSPSDSMKYSVKTDDSILSEITPCIKSSYQNSSIISFVHFLTYQQLYKHVSFYIWAHRYVTVVIRFASMMFIMLLPFPIYLQNRERNAMFNLNTGKSATVILILLHTHCCILYCFLYYIILPKWSKVSPASLF